MTSRCTYATKSGRFVVVTLSPDHLFDLGNFVGVVHEVSHHIYFKDFDVEAWQAGYLESVATLAVDTFVAEQGFVLDPAVRLSVRGATAEVLHVIVRGLRNQPGWLDGFGVHRGAIRKLAPSLQALAMTGAFSRLLGEQLGRALRPTDATAAESGAALGERFLGDPGTADALAAAITRACAAQQREFTEAIADLYSAMILGFDEYVAYMNRKAAAAGVALRPSDTWKPVLADALGAGPSETSEAGTAQAFTPLVACLRQLARTYQQALGAVQSELPLRAIQASLHDAWAASYSVCAKSSANRVTNATEEESRE